MKNSWGINVKSMRIIAAIVIVLLLTALPLYADQAVIRILHTNDFHGFAEPYRPYGSDEIWGGIANLASEVEMLRRERPTLLLAAGDMIQGNNWANLFQGQSVIELMNAMKFDAMVVGNHEFDFGQDQLKKRIESAAFPVLGANVAGFEGLKPYVIKTVGGIRVGIIGVVTEETPQTTHPRNVAGLKFLSPEDTARKYVNEIRNDVDIIVLLSHLGHTADRLIAARISGIDVIVGGHSHTRIERPAEINGAVVAQAWEHAKAVGLIDLSVDNGKLVKAEGRIMEIRPGAVRTDSRITSIVEKYRGSLDAAFDKVIGEAMIDLDGQNTRRMETNLGNFIADIVRSTAGADAAIIGGGSIRASIKKGSIRVRDIYDVSPFNNYIVALRLTGRQVKEALEHGVTAVDDNAGRYPQVSGIKFVYSRSAAAGNKVLTALINGRQIEPEKEYIVATDDFLASGGDGYRVFSEAVRTSKEYIDADGQVQREVLAFNNTGRWLRDLVMDHIRKVKIVSPMMEGRIRESD